MDINSFTNSVKEILVKSSEFATEKKSQSITSEMFLKAALTGSNLYSDILGRVNVDKVNLTHELDNEIAKVNSVEGDIVKVAELSSDKTGISMEVMTDLPGMQIYTANFLENKKGKKGSVYGRRSGCCFETQYFPNACNEKSFKSSIISAGEEYKSTTVFKFNIKDW